jgi:hypothetical protein
MPPLPPFELVLEIGFQAFLVPFAVAAAVAILAARCPRCGGQAVRGALALVAAFLAGNYFRQAVEFGFGPDRPFAPAEFLRMAWRALVTTGAPEVPLLPARYWLAWATLLGIVAELSVSHRCVKPVAAWVVRALATGVASRLLVPPDLREELPWLWPALFASILGSWWLIENVNRDSRAGWLAPGLAGLSLAAATVLIHAHSARLTDAATILAGGWSGVAVAAYWRRTHPGCTAPVAAIGLPALMLVGQQSTFSEVPTASFVLVALAPLALLPLVFVKAERRQGWRFAIAGWLLLLVPAGLAVLLAMRAETLSFE